jgi:ssDNA-specific exonuclease RecJ
MSDQNLKDKLINEIKATDEPVILEEVSRLFELQEPETIYQVNEEKKSYPESKRTNKK